MNDEIIAACKMDYPDETDLHEMLINAKLPDCKQPEC
jgi:hypothetical protein